MRENLEHELPQWLGKSTHSWVYTGGIHATAGGLTSASFATEAFVPERVSQTATAITYPAGVNDICWAIISSDNNGITGWTRVGTTSYYVRCEGDTTPDIPDLPVNSAYMLMAKITTSAIAAVSIVGPRGPQIGGLDATLFPGDDIGAKINAAAAALPFYGQGATLQGVEGGIIRIPAGEYIFSTPIVITRQATCIIGEGLYTHNSFDSASKQGAATLLRYTGAGSAITLGEGTTSQHQGMCLKNFKLMVPAGITGVTIEQSSAWGIMEEVFLSGPSGNRTGTGLLLANSSYGWRVRNCQFENFGTGIILDGNNGALMFEGNQVLRNLIGMVVGYTTSVAGTQITNNDIEINETWGIELRRSINTNIAFNYVEAGGPSFPNSVCVRIGFGAGESNTNVTIMGNYLHTGGAGPLYAIGIRRATGVNIFFNNSPAGYNTAVVDNGGTPDATQIRYGWNIFTGTPTEFTVYTGVEFFTSGNNGRIYTGQAVLQAGGTFDAARRGLTVDAGASTSWDLAYLRNDNGIVMNLTGALHASFPFGILQVGEYNATKRGVYIDTAGSTSWNTIEATNDNGDGLIARGDRRIQMPGGNVNIGPDGLTEGLVVDKGVSTGHHLFRVRNADSEAFRITGSPGIAAQVYVDALRTAGAAGGKKVVCVDTADGRLYVSSTGVDCSN